MEIRRTAGDATKGPPDRFTGDVWLWPRIGATGHTEVRIVLFTPGARSAWHRHPAGQVLHVTEGAGRVQCRGGAREEIRVGDTAMAAPGEWHWHGATPGAFMVHLAATDGPTEWGRPVTDDEYRGDAPGSGSDPLPPAISARMGASPALRKMPSSSRAPAQPSPTRAASRGLLHTDGNANMGR